MTDRYALAEREAVRDLQAQEASVTSLRAAATCAVAAATAATGFLAPEALAGHAGFPWPAWVVAGALAATVIAALYVVAPAKITTTASATEVLDGKGWADLGYEDAVRTFVGFADGWSAANDKKIRHRVYVLQGVAAGVAVTVLAWTYLLTRR